MFGSFRTRIAVTVVVLVGVTALLVGVLAYVLVEQSLRDQLVADGTAQADFNIGVLAGETILAPDAGRVEFEETGLAARFLQRGSDGLYVEFSGDQDPYFSGIAFSGAGIDLPAELRQLVEDGRLGFAFVDLADDSYLVVGGRRPSNGPDFYFFTSAAEVDNALSQLLRVLVGAGAVVVMLAALAAGFISRRVLRPVRTASDAAAAMAAGDLSVRLPAESDDEFGQWAESFNTMAGSLESKVAELQAAHEREQRFVADVSHELRTPLTALVAEAEMANSFLATMPESAGRIGELLTADTARLRHLVEDLLEISRLEAPATPSDATAVDIRPFLEAVIADRHPGAVLRAGDARVECDRRGLERIVGNLLDNASQHAPGADVTVEAQVGAADLRVTVADDGPGVAVEALAKIFDRFYTTDAARQGGSGLGLAIARRHAQRMGGDLTARVGSPHGLVFELLLPVTVPLHDRNRAEKQASQAEGESTPSDRSTP